MARTVDTVRIESVQGGDFSIVVDRATAFEIVNDLTQPSQARFELGDDGTWSVIKDALATGTRFVIYVNDTPRLTGRLLAKNLPITASGGATVQCVVRTALADAAYSSAKEFTLRKATLKEALLRVYEPLGFQEKDFVFRANVARDLLTGVAGRADAPVDLQPIKEDEARVHPPETIRDFAERHLSRFHLTHWDSPDGKIVVGTPNDQQHPTYSLRLQWRGKGEANNLEQAEKVEDFEDVPGELWVFGVGGGKGAAKAKVQWLEPNPTLFNVDPVLFRRVSVIDESIKTEAQAQARARREMSARARMSDAWRLTTDGLSYWDGSRRIPWAVDSVADLTIDPYGGASGAYLIYRTTLSGNADQGFTSVLETCARGVWRL